MSGMGWITARRRLVRPLSWTGLLAVMALDALVASNISLGLLYFVPLVFAAFRMPRGEALLFALVCTAGRVFLGPTGDPLGLQGVTFHLPSELEVAVNAVVAGLAYLAVAFALARLREQAREIRRLDRQVETDALTGVPNRRALQRTLEEHAETGTTVAVLCMDVDHFKQVNDVHGHDAGDLVLREVAARLQACVRGPDLVARTGGEEFVVVLPRTPLDGAQRVAERILHAVRSRPIPLGTASLSITISIGCAVGPANELLVQAADRAMYEAKRGGRDRVTLAAAA